MPHLHPPLSAFPFALLSVALLLELHAILRPKRRHAEAIRLNLFAAALFTAAAFLSGYAASEGASVRFTVPESALVSHHAVGRLLLMLLFPTLGVFVLWERGPKNPAVFRALYLVLLVVCHGLACYTGYLGGELVFTHGAGVTAEPAREGLSAPEETLLGR